MILAIREERREVRFPKSQFAAKLQLFEKRYLLQIRFYPVQKYGYIVIVSSCFFLKSLLK